MTLVREEAGVGELLLSGTTVCRAPYRLKWFQGVSSSGMPVPGMHRIDGSFDADVREWVGAPVTLKLEDGRMVGINLIDASGRFFSEGHGPSRCGCC